MTESQLTVPFTRLDRRAEGASAACSGSGDLRTRIKSEVYKIAFSDLMMFEKQIAGLPTNVGTGSGSIIQNQPLRHWYDPSCYYASHSWFGIGPTEIPASPYEFAIVTVNFATPSYSFSGDTPYFSRRTRLSGVAVTCPSAVYKFADNLAADQGVAQLIAQREILLTWHNLPFLNDAKATLYINKTNTSTFLGFDPGTVLFVGTENDAGTIFGEGQRYDVVYSFLWRQIEWNKFRRPDTGAWAYVFDGASGSGNKVFADADLSQLFVN